MHSNNYYDGKAIINILLCFLELRYSEY